MYAMFLQFTFLALRQGWGNRRFIAALLVLLTPCIDYVVVFTQ